VTGDGSSDTHICDTEVTRRDGSPEKAFGSPDTFPG